MIEKNKIYWLKYKYFMKKRKKWIERDDLYLRERSDLKEKEFDKRIWLKGRSSKKKWFKTKWIWLEKEGLNWRNKFFIKQI